MLGLPLHLMQLYLELVLGFLETKNLHLHIKEKTKERGNFARESSSRFAKGKKQGDRQFQWRCGGGEAGAAGSGAAAHSARVIDGGMLRSPRRDQATVALDEGDHAEGTADGCGNGRSGSWDELATTHST